MNVAALMAIARYVGHAEMHVALQGRVLGSKGLWVLHPTDHAPDSPPRIWIRPSQRKINLVDPARFSAAALRGVHPANLIFDLVAAPKVSFPARLSRLTVLNMDANGIPTAVFVTLMESTLRAEIAALTTWTGPAAMQVLWHAVNKASGVTAGRLQRSVAGMQRALGLASRFEDDLQADQEVEEGFEGAEGADGPADGKPLSVGEKILERLQAGFLPTEDFFLYDDLRMLITNTAEKAVREYHIEMPQSVEMFIIPGTSYHGQTRCGR